MLCAPLLAAWGLGLTANMTPWTMFLFALGVWLVTVAGAYALERAGRRGPAEVLLRECAHRRAVRPVEASSGEDGEETHQERTTR